jgi:hypothetical protein
MTKNNVDYLGVGCVLSLIQNDIHHKPVGVVNYFYNYLVPIFYFIYFVFIRYTPIHSTNSGLVSKN